LLKILSTKKPAMQNLPEIENQLSSKDLFAAFKIQLAKDFEQSNFPSEFVTALEPTYSSILKKISFELERNVNIKLMQLLHRIDISEGQLKKYVAERTNESYFNVIAELIIKRELQKVVIKRFYRDQ
jgi:hypothetical protein